MRSFGWNTNGQVNEGEARILRRIAREVVADDTSLSGAVRWLNEHDIRTTTGRRWEVGPLRRALAHPRMVGGCEVGGHMELVAGRQPILDLDTWQRLRDVIEARGATGRQPGVTEHYLLAGGLACCGRCGTHLVANRSSPGGKRSYICPRTRTPNPLRGGCGGIRVMAEPLEDYVAERVLARLSSPRTATAIARAVRREQDLDDALRRRLDDDREKLRALATEWADNEVTRDEWKHARGTLERRIREAQQTLARARALHGAPAPVDTAELPARWAEWWQRAGVDRRRALLGMLVREVKVHPVQLRGGRQFEADRVEIVWR